MFERCEAEAQGAGWSAVELDFLKLIEEEVREAGNDPDADDVVSGKIGFHDSIGLLT